MTHMTTSMVADMARMITTVEDVTMTTTVVDTVTIITAQDMTRTATGSATLWAMDTVDTDMADMGLDMDSDTDLATESDMVGMATDMVDMGTADMGTDTVIATKITEFLRCVLLCAIIMMTSVFGNANSSSLTLSAARCAARFTRFSIHTTKTLIRSSITPICRTIALSIAKQFGPTTHAITRARNSSRTTSTISTT